MLGGVFICYRRKDSAGFARLIYDRLISKLDAIATFSSTSTPSRSALISSIFSPSASAGARTLMAIIVEARRRASISTIVVASTIRMTLFASRSRAALARKIRVIPVLVDGAPMPQPDHLPDSLKKLARRQGIEISHTRFYSDVDRCRALSLLDEELRQREAAEAERAAPLERERREAEEIEARRQQPAPTARAD